MKTTCKPDINKITYEEEKAALILGMPYSMVDIKMSYFLLVFVTHKVRVGQNSNNC